MNYEISSDNEGLNALNIIKNIKIKEDGDNKNILKSISEESEDNKIIKKSLNKNEIEEDKNIFNINSNIININNNKNTIKINYKKDKDNDSSIDESKSNSSNNLSNKNDANQLTSINKNNKSNEESKNINIKVNHEQKQNIFVIYNIDNSSQNTNLNNNKDYYFSSSSFSSSSKMKNDKKNSINENDIIILKETNKNAIILSLDNSFIQSFNTTHFTNTINNNKILKFDEIKNEIDNGNFKFFFEINPKTQNKIPIKVEVGFEVTFADENDYINIFNDEENDILNKNDKNDILNSLCQKYCISRQFNIFKKTNKINVLINIDYGKFFIIGDKELNIKNNKELLSGNNNFNILYLCNCQSIPLDQIKAVRPIFNLNQKSSNIAEILINGK